MYQDHQGYVPLPTITTDKFIKFVKVSLTLLGTPLEIQEMIF